MMEPSERLREIARAIKEGREIAWDYAELFKAANTIDYLAGKKGCDECHDKWQSPVRGIWGGETWKARAAAHGAEVDRLKDRLRVITKQRDAILAALEDFDSLIRYQYSGSIDALSALQRAAFAVQDAIKAAKGGGFAE